MFEVRKEVMGNVFVLFLSGKLDALTASQMKPVMKELESENAMKIVLDFKDLTLIDSSGIGAVVSIFKQARSKGGEVKIAGLHEQPKEVFEILNLHKAMDVYPTVEQAVESY
ncbi:MAG: STAS domain-containing protein [Deltaproteobacteria bacterium]|nr:STAS domain-containing protein [Deltaproteobacteria bacterium]